MAIRRFACALALGLAVPASAVVLFNPGTGHATWHRLAFTRKWDMPATDAPEFAKFSAYLTWRVQSESLLVALTQPYGERYSNIVSSNRHVVDLRNGNVRDARSGEWDASRPIATHETDPFRELPVKQGNTVSYLKRQFVPADKVLERWALSPDGSWLAIISYSGTVNRYDEFFEIRVARGTFQVDIFKVSTGERTTGLSGTFFLEDPFESLDNATWISDRHFIIPMPGFLGALLCDVRPAAPPRETVWDFVDGTNEILGFREEPQRGGYFDAVVKLRLHTAVRVAKAGMYNLRADVDGPRAMPAYGSSRMEAGTGSVDADIAYPKSNEKVEIRAMTLTNSPGNISAAKAEHLGPTEEYESYTAHPPPEPRPLPRSQDNATQPPFAGRRLPDSIQVKGVDRDPLGKFAALSVSIPLVDWPISTCFWEASLVDSDDAWVVQARVDVPRRSKEATLVFDGASIAASSAKYPLHLGLVKAQCRSTAGTWRVIFENNPLHRITTPLRDDFTKVPLSQQAKPTGENAFELMDNDHDGLAEFLRVQLGVKTNRRNCILSVSIIDPSDHYLGILDLLQDPDGHTFSGYADSALLKDKTGLFGFRLDTLRCGGQALPLAGQTIVKTRFNAPKVRRPFTIALSAPFNTTANHGEYWVDCDAKTSLQFPLSISLGSLPFEGLEARVEPEAGPCVAHAFKIVIDAGANLQPDNYEQVFHVHAPGGSSWSGEEIRFQWKVNDVPEIFGVNPTAGIGPEAHFHVAALDRNYDINRVDLLINDRLDEKGGCYVSYLTQTPGLNTERRGILLHSDDGRSDAVGSIDGTTGAENNRCAVKKSWDQLLRDVTISFKPAFRGSKNIYARAIDSTGASSGWKQTGTWIASDEESPEPVAVRPYLGAGLRQTFAFDFSDVNGNDDIRTAEILIQFGHEKASACAITVDRNAGLVRLMDGGATGILPFNTPGAIARNPQCAITDAVITTESRDGLHVTMNIEFDRSFKGRRNIYARAQDRAGQSSPWRWLGSWVVSGL
jgi:hypothetical protein